MFSTTPIFRGRLEGRKVVLENLPISNPSNLVLEKSTMRLLRLVGRQKRSLICVLVAPPVWGKRLERPKATKDDLVEGSSEYWPIPFAVARTEG